MNFQDSADALSHLLRVHVLDIQPPNTYSAGQYLLQLGCSTPFMGDTPDTWVDNLMPGTWGPLTF